MIAVTGANGLLGSFVIRKLIQQGEEFIAIRRKDSDTSLLDDVASKISWRVADILDPVSLREALNGATHVVHAAATVSINPRRIDEIMDINVVGTRNVVNLCIDLGAQRLVHVSSVAALGAQKGQHQINENNKWIETPFNSIYGKSKYLAELEVFRGQEEGLSTVIVNPSVILAEANWKLSSAQFFKYVWDERPFYIDGYVNYVDVKDVVEIIYMMLSLPIEAQRFIVSAGNIRFIELFGKIAHEFSKKAPSIKVPRSVLKPFAFVESLRSRITKTEPKITRETARLASTQFLFDNTRIKKNLNFEFQPIDETLKRCCRYYIEKVNAKK